MGKLDARPVRSLLYTPGDQEQRIVDNVKSGADALFLDVEEPRTPCPEATRVRARGLVREFLDSAPVGAGAPIYFVRVQPVASGMILRDLQAVLGPNLAGILLPKITGPADVHAADAILGCLETELGMPVGRTMLYPILENATAIRNAYEIAMASPRVAYIGGAVSRFGDIVADGRLELDLFTAGDEQHRAQRLGVSLRHRARLPPATRTRYDRRGSRRTRAAASNPR